MTTHKNHNHGFTLIELMYVVLIIAILIQVAYPFYRNETNKAGLAELALRVDQMRTSMQTAYQSGDPRVFTFPYASAGQIPQELRELPFSDDLTHPTLTLNVAPSDQPMGAYIDGRTRPFLIISAHNQEEAEVLNSFSQILPQSIWSWWQEPMIMVVPLIDLDAQATTPPVISSTPGNSGTAPGQGGTPPGNAGNPPGLTSTTPATTGTNPGPTSNVPPFNVNAPPSAFTSPVCDAAIGPAPQPTGSPGTSTSTAQQRIQALVAIGEQIRQGAYTACALAVAAGHNTDPRSDLDVVDAGEYLELIRGFPEVAEDFTGNRDIMDYVQPPPGMDVCLGNGNSCSASYKDHNEIRMGFGLQADPQSQCYVRYIEPGGRNGELDKFVIQFETSGC